MLIDQKAEFGNFQSQSDTNFYGPNNPFMPGEVEWEKD